MTIEPRKIILSGLWIFLSVNYIFCDVLSNMMPDFLKLLMEDGQLLGMPVNENFLLGTALFMEIPFLMIILSLVLAHKYNRIINMVAAALMAALQIFSLFTGEATLHYIFYSIVEITALAIIFSYAMKWKVELK